MSTRSLIWKEQQDGSYKGVYCHNDGYIKNGVGETLFKYYNSDNVDRIDKLIALGNLSSLGTYIDPLPNGVHKEYIFEPKLTIKYKFGSEHTFDNPQEDVCVAYHRDRGEELENLNEPNLDAVIEGSKHSWAEFIYIFKNNKWYVIDIYGDNCLKPLTI